MKLTPIDEMTNLRKGIIKYSALEGKIKMEELINLNLELAGLSGRIVTLATMTMIASRYLGLSEMKELHNFSLSLDKDNFEMLKSAGYLVAQSFYGILYSFSCGLTYIGKKRREKID